MSFAVDNIDVELSKNVCEVVVAPMIVVDVTAGVVTAMLEFFLINTHSLIFEIQRMNFEI